MNLPYKAQFIYDCDKYRSDKVTHRDGNYTSNAISGRQMLECSDKTLVEGVLLCTNQLTPHICYPYHKQNDL